MAITNKTFRIFVSSTFSDLREERNALQKEVFPRLRKLCMQHGFRFQAIDLRWGVREESALDQQTMNICLDEVARCKRPPNPNFVVLLGDRYGWQPLPGEIPAEEFEQLEKHVSGENDRSLLRRWYKRDDNAVPAVYCIQPREVAVQADAPDSEKRRARDAESMHWRNTEADLRRILREAIRHVPLSEEQRAKYESSATEQEIEAGALSAGDAGEHVYCFFREIKGLPQDESAEDFTDLKAGEGKKIPDTRARGKLDDLKNKLEKKLGDSNIFRYGAEWTGNGITTDHIQKLCEDVYASLSGIIEKEISEIEEKSALDREIDAHKDFGEKRARVFVGRVGILNRIQDYIRHPGTGPLAVYGESGTGKSALMAYSLQQTREQHPDAVTVFRFIGATPESSDSRSLLESLCKQIYEAFDYEQQKQQRLANIVGETEKAQKERDRINSEYSIPGDMKKLPETFHNFLVKVPKDKRLILYLDALDQLSDAYGAGNINWLPGKIPEHIRLIVSVLHGECHQALERRIPEENLTELQAMPAEDGEKLLDLWLSDAGRVLQRFQRKELLKNFNHKGNGKPLYLKLVFEESRRWKSYTKNVQLSSDIRGVIQHLFKRLSLNENHGEMLLSRSLGYLAAARHGLSEDELIDVLSADREVFDDFRRRAFHEPPEQRLPVVLWSRLYFDLEPYLTERNAEGASTMSFYHRQFAETTYEEYLSGEDRKERHKGLAEYFNGQSLYQEKDERKTPNLRKLAELPFQQASSELWNDLYSTLTDMEFLEQKNTHFTIYDLLSDYRTALGQMPQENEVGNQRGILGAFSAALDKASAVLKEDPELTFPRIYNQLQWETGENNQLREILEFEKNRFKRPWLRLASQPSESSALIRTFTGHTGSVYTCAFNHDGTRIVSGGSDNTLRIWNTETGEEICILKGHFGSVDVCAYSPDDNFIASVSSDRTLRLWDANSGDQIHVLKGHKVAVKTCAFSPDGKRIVSGGFDKILKIWDTETGRDITTFEGHTGSVISCDFSPDGRQIVSGSRDKTLKVWNVDSGKEVLTLGGHTRIVQSCAFSSDGKLIASAGGNLKLWNAKTGNEIHTFDRIETGNVVACSFTPDNNLIVSGGNRLTVWDVKTGTEISSHEGYSNFAFSADGKYIVTGGTDHTLKLWDAGIEHRAQSLSGQTDVLGPFVFSPDGTRILSAGNRDMPWSNILKLRDVKSGKEICTLSGHAKSINCFAFSPDGKRIISASGDKTLKLWDATAGEEIHTFWGHSLPVYCCAFSKDGKRIVSGSIDQTLKVWDTKTGVEIYTCKGHTDFVRCCAFSPDGRYIVSGSNDKNIKLWDAETGMEIITFSGHADAITRLVFSPDARCILSESMDHTFTLWENETGNKIFTHESGNPCFSPDGRFIVSGNKNVLKLWEANTGREIFTYQGHREPVRRFAFSPDGRLIVSDSNNEVIKLWDTAAEVEISTLASHLGKLADRVYSPGGRHVILRKGYAGNIQYSHLENVEGFIPLISAVKGYNFSDNTGEGFWDEDFSSTCWWCGLAFQVSHEMLNSIQDVRQESRISSSRPSRKNPRNNVHLDDRLLLECPGCHRPLRFNPFLVDNSRNKEPSHVRKPIRKETGDKSGSDASRHFDSGMEYWNKGLTESAINEWRLVTGSQSNHAEAHHHLGLAYSKLGLNGKAQEHFKRALELGHQGTREHIENLWEKRFESSENSLKPLVKEMQDFTKQIQRDSRSKAIQINNLGISNLRKGLKDTAISYFKKSIRIDPAFALPHINLGIEYINQNRIQEGITEYKEAIRVEPNNANAYYYLGDACVRLNSFKEALVAFEKAVSVNKNHADSHNMIGIVLVQLKNYDKAIGHFERAVELGHKKAEANLEIAVKKQKHSSGKMSSLFKRRPK